MDPPSNVKYCRSMCTRPSRNIDRPCTLLLPPSIVNLESTSGCVDVYLDVDDCFFGVKFGINGSKCYRIKTALKFSTFQMSMVFFIHFFFQQISIDSVSRRKKNRSLPDLSNLNSWLFNDSRQIFYHNRTNFYAIRHISRVYKKKLKLD